MLKTIREKQRTKDLMIPSTDETSQYLLDKNIVSVDEGKTGNLA